MMGGGWLRLYLTVVVHLLDVVAEDHLEVTMCCPAGQMLKIVKNNGKRLGAIQANKGKSIWNRKDRGDDYIAKCVRSRRAQSDTLEGSTITVVNGENEDLIVVKKTGARLPSCTLGRRFQTVSLKSKESVTMGNEDTEEVVSDGRVRLRDFDCGKILSFYSKSCYQGNVYMDDKPVCDDGWDDNAAKVVCKELGFTGHGYSTKDSFFGNVNLERQSGFDEVRCSGKEASLVDCSYETSDDCGDSEGAGVVCYRDADDYLYEDLYYKYDHTVLLTSTGDLVLHDNSTYKAGEYCMAAVFQGEDEWNKGEQEGEAMAVMCEPCKSEVLCSVLLLDIFSYWGDELITDGSYGTPVYSTAIGILADKNKDGKVDFNEFNAAITDYVKKVFIELDKDGDGSLDKDASMKSLSIQFFHEILGVVFLSQDLNQDGIVSVEDTQAPKSIFDRNNDDKISFREFTNLNLINLPAPLYQLYATLDNDRNEKISRDEASNFINGAFAMIDQNEDCSIDISEIISSLDESKLPKQYQLAIKLLGDYYLEMGDFILKEFIAAADADGDGDMKASFAEIIGLKNPAVLFEILTMVNSMGKPQNEVVDFIAGYIPGTSDEHMMTVRDMWLKVLYDFVENKKFQSAPAGYCGLV